MYKYRYSERKEQALLITARFWNLEGIDATKPSKFNLLWPGQGLFHYVTGFGLGVGSVPSNSKGCEPRVRDPHADP